jgi:hypothetical protein
MGREANHLEPQRACDVVQDCHCPRSSPGAEPDFHRVSWLRVIEPQLSNRPSGPTNSLTVARSAMKQFSELPARREKVFPKDTGHGAATIKIGIQRITPHTCSVSISAVSRQVRVSAKSRLPLGKIPLSLIKTFTRMIPWFH